MKFWFLFILLPLNCSAASLPEQTLVFFGDSITAGYGLTLSEAYPALIEQKIREAKWPIKVVNAGLSGDTTASGEQRLRWVLRQQVDVLVIALGANDGLRGIDPDVTKSNLQKIIDSARSKRPSMQLVIAGMKMPPNFGAAYAARFERTFSDVAQRNQIPMIPFLLEGVGGVAELNQGDRVHPTAAGQKRVADNVWKTLRPLLAKRFEKNTP